MNASMIPRLSALVCAVAFTLSAPAWAESEAEEQVQTLLERIATTGTGEERLQAAEELAAIGVDAIAPLSKYLERERTSKGSDRRAVLKGIKADLPDKKGRFRTPKRKEAVNRGDDFDWLKELSQKETDQPGYGDVFADVAAIRALAASPRADAAEVVLGFTFTSDGLIYRDECGRYLRKMSPYSLPALIVTSQDSKKKRAYRRYASYQLDRMDRDNPDKALLHAAGDPELLLATLDAYGESKHREAIPTLMEYANHAAPSVRETARKALLAYVTGKKPKDAPKRKLQLPGGKYTKEPQPLWLNYREMASVFIRRAYQETFEEKPPRRTSLAKLAKMIFREQDRRRDEAQGKVFDDAMALAKAENWAEAAAAFDRVLAVQPEHAQRANMAKSYFEHGRALTAAGSFRPAAAAFSKAHGLAPDGPLAEDALANHYGALGKALEAEGKDASAAFRRARMTQTTGPVEEELAPKPTPKPRNRWMLYAGIGGGAGALILLILGLAIRRR